MAAAIAINVPPPTMLRDDGAAVFDRRPGGPDGAAPQARNRSRPSSQPCTTREDVLPNSRQEHVERQHERGSTATRGQNSLSAHEQALPRSGAAEPRRVVRISALPRPPRRCSPRNKLAEQRRHRRAKQNIASRTRTGGCQRWTQIRSAAASAARAGGAAHTPRRRRMQNEQRARQRQRLQNDAGRNAGSKKMAGGLPRLRTLLLSSKRSQSSEHASRQRGFMTQNYDVAGSGQRHRRCARAGGRRIPAAASTSPRA